METQIKETRTLIKSNMVGKVWSYIDIVESLSKESISFEQLKYCFEQKLKFQQHRDKEIEFLNLIGIYAKRLNENTQQIVIDLTKEYREKKPQPVTKIDIDLTQKMYKVSEVAKITGISRAQINYYTNTGKISCYKLSGKSKRITEKHLQEFLTSNFNRDLKVKKQIKEGTENL